MQLPIQYFTCYKRRQSGDWLAGQASNLGERSVHFGVVDTDQHIDVRSLSYGWKGMLCRWRHCGPFTCQSTACESPVTRSADVA